MCPGKGINISASNFGVLLNYNFGAEKRSFQPHDFVTIANICRLVQDIVDRKEGDHPHTCLPNLVNVGPQTAKNILISLSL